MLTVIIEWGIRKDHGIGLDLLRLDWVDWSYNTQVTYTMLAIFVIQSKFFTAIVKQYVFWTSHHIYPSWM